MHTEYKCTELDRHSEQTCHSTGTVTRLTAASRCCGSRQTQLFSWGHPVDDTRLRCSVPGYNANSFCTEFGKPLVGSGTTQDSVVDGTRGPRVPRVPVPGFYHCRGMPEPVVVRHPFFVVPTPGYRYPVLTGHGFMCSLVSSTVSPTKRDLPISCVVQTSARARDNLPEHKPFETLPLRLGLSP
eukprot:3932657-Rhodomonas_salina.1